jgi:lycopene cyclase domain-containing protein
MPIEYLLFNIIVFACPFIASYFGEKGYLPQLKPFAAVLLFVSLPFIIWDHFVTDYFWSFNPAYTTGLKIGNLPIEEVLFFVTVPYACLFVWIIIERKMKVKEQVNSLFPFLFIALIPIGSWYVMRGLEYTGSVYVVFGTIALIDMVTKTHLFQNRKLYTFFLICMGLMLVFNGYLTARPVVTYSEAVKTNIHIGSIPIEDFVYGMSLLSASVWVYKRFREKKPKSRPT